MGLDKVGEVQNSDSGSGSKTERVTNLKSQQPFCYGERMRMGSPRSRTVIVDYLVSTAIFVAMIAAGVPSILALVFGLSLPCITFTWHRMKRHIIACRGAPLDRDLKGH